VIVRIATEGQYEVPDELADRLNELDNRAVQAVESGDEDGFHAAFEELLDVIRSEGSELADDDLHESALIVPPSDLTFTEAGEQFSGEGLIPD
jgi:hypothetical protein